MVTNLLLKKFIDILGVALGLPQKNTRGLQGTHPPPTIVCIALPENMLTLSHIKIILDKITYKHYNVKYMFYLRDTQTHLNHTHTGSLQIKHIK